jgi:predicted nuclease of restriction endonuclease-like (RecB) superfamily
MTTPPTNPLDQTLPGDYDTFLRDLKERIRTAQVRAALSINRELILLYWQIGRDLVARQQQHGWGEAVIRRLEADLQHAFPGIEGFSYRNLYRMRAFHLAYPDEAAFVTQPVSQIPWGHNIVLFQKIKDPTQRLWYAHQATEYGWSRNVLVHQVESNLYARQGQALTNFERTLPPPQSDLAQELLKDPYHFDFLTLGRDAQERDLERGLLATYATFC